MKTFAAFLMLAAACLAADVPTTKLVRDRFTKIYTIEYPGGTIVSAGAGEEMMHHKQVKFTAFMILSDATPPSKPLVSLVFKIRHFAELWEFEETCHMLLDGKVTRLHVVTSRVWGGSEKNIVEEKAMVLLTASQASAFLKSKECAFRIGRDEFDVASEARKPAADVIARFRSELAAGTFNEFGKTKGQ